MQEVVEGDLLAHRTVTAGSHRIAVSEPGGFYKQLSGQERPPE